MNWRKGFRRIALVIAVVPALVAAQIAFESYRAISGALPCSSGFSFGQALGT